jgi:hypothetical protein
VLRGTIGLVIPDHSALLDRLKGVSLHLKVTQFSFRESNDGIETVCPWETAFGFTRPTEAVLAAWH